MIKIKNRKLIAALLIVFCALFTVIISQRVYAYTQEEKQMVKDWLSAHGYAPTWDGAYAAYDDYMAGRLIIDDPRVIEYFGTPYPTETPKTTKTPTAEKKSKKNEEKNIGNQTDEIPEIGEMAAIYEMMNGENGENPFAEEEAKSGSSEESIERMQKAAGTEGQPEKSTEGESSGVIEEQVVDETAYEDKSETGASKLIVRMLPFLLMICLAAGVFVVLRKKQ